MLKLLVSAVIALTVLLGPLGALAAELKIAVVDANGLLLNSSEGKRVQEAIKKKAEELGRPLGSKRQDLARQVEDFQKQAGVMKEDVRKAKAQELEKKMQDFDKQAGDADKQLAQFKESQLGPLSKKLEQAINQVAQENKLDLVLDKAMLLSLPNTSLDYTDKVRAKFGP
jgi:outer membrane protein